MSDSPDGDRGGRRSPSELLSLLNYRIERMDRDLQAIRTDIDKGRADFRAELRLEITSIKGNMVDPLRFQIVEKVVFGACGIILVAVIVALIRGLSLSPVTGIHP